MVRDNIDNPVLTFFRWQEIRLPVTDPSLIPPARGYHTANIAKQYMIIYGGVKGTPGEANVVHDDIWMFNTGTFALGSLELNNGWTMV